MVVLGGADKTAIHLASLVEIKIDDILKNNPFNPFPDYINPI